MLEFRQYSKSSKRPLRETLTDGHLATCRVYLLHNLMRQTTCVQPLFWPHILGLENNLSLCLHLCLNQEAYGCSPVHPAIQRISDEARKEQMMSSWNIST